MFREPTNETVVNIHQDYPYTLLERRISGDWISAREEDVIDEVLRVVSLEINPSEAIKNLESRNQEIEGRVKQIDEANERINKSIDKVDAALKEADEKIVEINQKAEQINNVVNEVSRQFMLSPDLTDEQRAEIVNQYRAVSVGDTVHPNEVVNINGELFKMVQPSPIRIDAEAWLTDSSLFTPFLQTTIIDEETGEEIEVVQEFRQPEGAHDSYTIGDKVLFEGQVYESIIDANVWSPITNPQGWSLVVEVEDSEDEEPQEPEEPIEPEEEEPEEEPIEPEEEEEEEEVADFVTPTGGHDAFSVGDRVRFNGKVYESTIDSNIWSPSDYPQGWTLVE